MKEKAQEPPCERRNGWWSGDATEDGIYLRGFSEWDDKEDADLFHLRSGKWYKDGITPYICYGGVWKKIADLPEPPKEGR